MISKLTKMNTQFSIPKPCHEDWNAMTPTEQGRFCSQCSKNVTDFTQMSDKEITIYFRQNSSSNICGRFRKDQLIEQTAIHIPRKVLYSQTKFINVFLLALLVTMGSMLFSCKQDTADKSTWDKPVDSVSTDSKMPHATVGMVSYPSDSVVPPSPVQKVDSVMPPPPVQKPQMPITMTGAVIVTDTINRTKNN